MRSLIVGFGLLLVSAGCEDKAALKQLEALSPRLVALQTKATGVAAALPRAGEEKDATCAAPIGGVIYPLDEHALQGDKITSDQSLLTFSALRVQTVEQLRKSDTLSASLQFLEKKLPLSEAVRHVVVLRGTTVDNGELADKEIVRPATWKGWAFVVAVQPPAVLAAWPVDLTSADSVHGITRTGHARDLLKNNVRQQLIDTTRAEAQRRCGVELKYNPESPF